MNHSKWSTVRCWRFTILALTLSYSKSVHTRKNRCLRMMWWKVFDSPVLEIFFVCNTFSICLKRVNLYNWLKHWPGLFKFLAYFFMSVYKRCERRFRALNRKLNVFFPLWIISCLFQNRSAFFTENSFNSLHLAILLKLFCEKLRPMSKICESELVRLYPCRQIYIFNLNIYKYLLESLIELFCLNVYSNCCYFSVW